MNLNKVMLYLLAAIVAVDGLSVCYLACTNPSKPIIANILLFTIGLLAITMSIVASFNIHKTEI